MLSQLALSQKLGKTYQTQYTNIFLGPWATFFGMITLAENPRNRVKSTDLSESKKNQSMPQRLKYNFLLKRKLYIGVNIKVVEQITSFLMSGQ
jgi:hypothetical protein